MKRFFTLLWVLALFCGCSARVDDGPENPLPANIQISFLQEKMSFNGFTAGVPGGEAEQIRTMVETALGEYPPGMLKQLGFVEILLAGNLTGEGAFSQGTYAGFTQKVENGWRMVLDTAVCHVGTIHHEMGHILDGILTAAGKLSEAEWMQLNPSMFAYGSRDWEGCSEFFVDEYAMTDLTEDRASVFEAAIQGGSGVFAGKSPLWLKLHTFSQAIRTCFDTQGWPAATIWELALK